jgi:hypothetical protein
MYQTSAPSPVFDEMKSLWEELQNAFNKDVSINPKNVKRLCELRLLRVKELVGNLQERNEVVKQKTRELIAKLEGPGLANAPDLADRIYAELDRYEIAASHWVTRESCVWHESEAYAIACGILILANEIH